VGSAHTQVAWASSKRAFRLRPARKLFEKSLIKNFSKNREKRAIFGNDLRSYVHRIQPSYSPITGVFRHQPSMEMG